MSLCGGHDAPPPRLLEAFGKVDIVEISYKKFKAQAAKDKGKEPKKNTTEYLFILCKPL